MLTLSRKRGERIIIGESIIVEVVRVQGGKVKLAITAPGSVLVRREELEKREGEK